MPWQTFSHGNRPWQPRVPCSPPKLAILRSRPNAPMKLRCPRCIECRYPREGLPEGVACPECAEPAAPREWLVVFGSSTEWDPRGAVVAALAMIGVGLVLSTLIWLTRAGPPIPMAVGLIIGGLVVLYRAKRAADGRPNGGDIVWIVKDEGIEIRGGMARHFWPWEQITYAIFEYGWRSVRLSFGGAHSDTSNEAGLWVSAGEAEAREIHQELRSRIAMAREREAKAAVAAGRVGGELNPPASPLPPPS